jgi:hypothetical protein
MWKRDVKSMPPTDGFYVSLKREGAPLTGIAIDTYIHPSSACVKLGAS